MRSTSRPVGISVSCRDGIHPTAWVAFWGHVVWMGLCGGLVATAFGEGDHGNLTGRYEAASTTGPSEGGDLTRHPDEVMKFRWTDDAGSSWDLVPNITKGVLDAGSGNPDIQLQFVGRPGASAVRAIRIKGRLYFRKPVPGQARAEAAVVAETTESGGGKVTRIDENTFAVGGVHLRKDSREISFDARVNQDGGPIEYLLVSNKGKTHESLFSCGIRPLDLNIALMLLGYEPSPELFEIRTADQRSTGRFPEVPEKQRSLARIAIAVAWKSGEEERAAEVNDLVMNSATGKSMAPGPWLYTGSLITKSGFRAEQTGDIMAIFSDPAAMVNHPGESRSHDDIWSVNRGGLPAKGAPVRITIKPYSASAESTVRQDR